MPIKYGIFKVHQVASMHHPPPAAFSYAFQMRPQSENMHTYQKDEQSNHDMSFPMIMDTWQGHCVSNGGCKMYVVNVETRMVVLQENLCYDQI
ncbi:hypothetical protein Pyn_10449 [Prunus yedoensis var. nudiflora]|uniref:Uncharacterized protein n=1 Tax=Prunus yedoensis var. nudiflora TaxID=2094558 RepID=A0A314ZU85_PRUYE|nr:hypothetical protein Pyn_10449 [Prunus yedoensis var. nudiflora]